MNGLQSILHSKLTTKRSNSRSVTLNFHHNWAPFVYSSIPRTKSNPSQKSESATYNTNFREKSLNIRLLLMDFIKLNYLRTRNSRHLTPPFKRPCVCPLPGLQEIFNELDQFATGSLPSSKIHTPARRVSIITLLPCNLIQLKPSAVTLHPGSDDPCKQIK